MIAFFFAITFNQFQWNLNPSDQLPFLSEFERMSNSTFYTTTWKYKLQYHIIDIPILFYLIQRFISNGLQNTIAKRLHTFTISIVFLILIIPNYFAHSFETTVRSNWNENLKSGVLPVDSCLPISPLTDWGFESSGSFDASNWIANSCHGLWLKGNLPFSELWESDRITQIMVESSKLDENALVTIQLITQVPREITMTCFEPNIDSKLIFRSQQAPTRSGYIYTLVGIRNQDLVNFIKSWNQQFNCNLRNTEAYLSNLQILLKN
jgi:hypothetical protein